MPENSRTGAGHRHSGSGSCGRWRATARTRGSGSATRPRMRGRLRGGRAGSSPWKSEPPVTSMPEVVGERAIALDIGGAVLAVVHLDGVEALVAPPRDLVVAAVEHGMRHRGQPARVVQHRRRRRAPTAPRAGPTRARPRQSSVSNASRVARTWPAATIASASAGRPKRAVGGRGRQQRLDVHRDAALRQALGHRAQPVSPRGALRRQAARERRRVRVEEVAEDVDVAAAVDGRDLDAVDQREAEGRRGRRAPTPAPPRCRGR